MASQARNAPGSKVALRAWALRHRAQETLAGAAAAGERCAARVAENPRYAGARVVAGYLSLPGELSVNPLLRRCVADGKFVAVPAWNPVARRYAFCRWTPGTPLRSGPMRVPEPVWKDWVPCAQFDLVLVPGLVFDLAGGRIGFGAGHYDRMLSRCRASACFVGIAYAWQVLRQVPQGLQDIRLHAIATPDAWLATLPH